MNGNSKIVWTVGALAAAGLAYWYFIARAGQATSADGEGDSSGDSPLGGGQSSASQSDGSAAEVLSTLRDYATNIGVSLGIVTPKGIRNNNPGNLRYVASIAWKGQVGDDGTGYAVFDTPEDGARALGHQLRTYLSRGINSIASIISTYAPSSENDTAAYIADVSQRVGVDANQPLGDDAVPSVAIAITYHEQGSFPYDADAFAQWVNEP